MLNSILLLSILLITLVCLVNVLRKSSGAIRQSMKEVEDELRKARKEVEDESKAWKEVEDEAYASTTTQGVFSAMGCSGCIAVVVYLLTCATPTIRILVLVILAILFFGHKLPPINGSGGSGGLGTPITQNESKKLFRPKAKRPEPPEHFPEEKD